MKRICVCRACRLVDELDSKVPSRVGGPLTNRISNDGVGVAVPECRGADHGPDRKIGALGALAASSRESIWDCPRVSHDR
ncbi:MAG: hypothetical protein FJ336_06645 [Sphingomonadales bacterium]|nr:hypothetical protein [Sphingomonadales bacterium]